MITEHRFLVSVRVDTRVWPPLPQQEVPAHVECTVVSALRYATAGLVEQVTVKSLMPTPWGE
jgi:hypothetical protein